MDGPYLDCGLEEHIKSNKKYRVIGNKVHTTWKKCALHYPTQIANFEGRLIVDSHVPSVSDYRMKS